MMGIDKQAILGLIARQPKIRTVEIADKIDCEPDQVELQLREEIRRGDIMVEQVRAPNGRMVDGFEFSKSFMLTGEYRKLMPFTPEKAAPAPVAKPPKVDSRTHVQRAVDHLKERNEPITSNEMRIVLGLGPRQHPSVFLQSGRKSGALVYSDGLWSLTSPSSQGNESVAPASREVTVAPAAQTEPEPIVEPIESPPAAIDFAYAVWTTGELSIRLGDRRRELSVEEVKILRAQIDRIPVSA